MSRQHLPFPLPLTGLAAMAAVVLVGWASGAGAQTASELAPPPLPPVVQDDPAQNTAAPAAEAPAARSDNADAPTNGQTGNLPPLPLGQDGVREVQSQLIALGFDPGPADGEQGPATIGAAQQYNETRGGSGPVPIDGALLARLQQDTGPRLTQEQVAARAQPRYQGRAPAASNPIVGAVHQFKSNLRSLFNGGY